MNFNPVLLDIPELITTPRLKIRAISSGDGLHHFAAVQESLSDLRLYLADLPWVKGEQTLSNSELHCRENYARFIKREGLSYFIFLNTENGSEHFIGSIGLHRIDWAVPKFEIGYWCRVSQQKKGYITEAVKAMTALCFDQLAAKRVEIRVQNEHQASWKIAENTGYELEGILRHAYRDSVSNTLLDMRVYAQIR